MALIHEVRRSVLPWLAVAAVVSCGRPAEPGGAFQPAAAEDGSPRKGGEPAGALPSLVTSDEVAAFQATPAGAGPRKDRNAAGSLPSSTTAGKSAAYAPRGRQEPSAARGALLDASGPAPATARATATAR